MVNVPAEKLMFLGLILHLSKLAPQPLREDSMLTGPLSRPTSLCDFEDRRNQDGEGLSQQYGADFIKCDADQSIRQRRHDHPEYSHVVAALIPPLP